MKITKKNYRLKLIQENNKIYYCFESKEPYSLFWQQRFYRDNDLGFVESYQNLDKAKEALEIIKQKDMEEDSLNEKVKKNPYIYL